MTTTSFELEIDTETGDDGKSRIKQILFRSTDMALRFAYEVETTAIIKTSSLGGFVDVKGDRKSVECAMDRHDWHAQGAMIRSMVDRLPKLDRAFIRAFYGVGEVRGQAINLLTFHVITLQPQDEPVSVERMEALQLMVKQFVGAEMRSISRVLEMVEMRKQVALDLRREVWRVLEQIEKQAIGVIDQRLTEGGAVP